MRRHKGPKRLRKVACVKRELLVCLFLSLFFSLSRPRLLYAFSFMDTPTTFHHRSTFRPNTQDRSKQWRERFRQQCAERVKSARQNQVDKRRQNKVRHGVTFA